MGYSSIAIANSFIGKANIGEISNLTPMKLRKLMFYTQSWYIKLYGKPLFEGGGLKDGNLVRCYRKFTMSSNHLVLELSLVLVLIYGGNSKLLKKVIKILCCF